MGRRQISVAVLAAGLALTATACSSQQSSPTAQATTVAGNRAHPPKWAAATCGWLGSLYGEFGKLTESINQNSQPKQVKTTYLKFFDGVSKAMTDGKAKLTAVGVPNVADGQAIHDALLKFIDDAGKSVAEQKTQLSQLDPTNPGFEQKIEQLSGSNINPADALQKLKSNTELDKAAQQAPECKKMTEQIQSGIGTG